MMMFTFFTTAEKKQEQKRFKLSRRLNVMSMSLLELRHYLSRITVFI